jgi:putative ABC transport system permease protein
LNDTSWAGFSALGLLALVLPLVAFLGLDPLARRLTLDSTLRRPRQAAHCFVALVVWGAMVTVPVIVGASLRTSILRSATTQLGPVDEVVVAEGQSPTTLARKIAAARVTYVDGVLPMLVLPVTLTTNAYVERLSPAQLVEFDFADASRLGGDPAATGIVGPAPGAGQAVADQDLAHDVSIEAGNGLSPSGVTLHLGAAKEVLDVTRIVPRIGIAGLPVLTGAPDGHSLDLFVPPGTIESLAARGGGDVRPMSVVAVSNSGGVLGGLAHSASVTAALDATFGNEAVSVRPIKEQVVLDADQSGRQFTEAFAGFAALGGAVGLVLMVLCLSLVLDERAGEHAVLRVFGDSRRRLGAHIAAEAWLWAIVGTTLGIAIGVVVSHLIVWGARTTVAATRGVKIQPAVSGADLERCLLIGIGGALVVVVLVSARAARRHIGAGLRGPAARSTTALDGPAGRAVALAGLALAGAVTAVVTSTHSFHHPGPVALAASGLALTAALLMVGSVVWGRSPGLLVGRGIRWRRLPLRFAGAYLGARSIRTWAAIGLYAVVAFSLAFVACVASSVGSDLAAAAHRMGGTSAVEVPSNASDPVPAGDVSNQPGVTAVAETTEVSGQLGTGQTVSVVGFGDSLVSQGMPALSSWSGRYGSADEVFRSVAADPGLVLVGADLTSNPESGLTPPAPRPGERLLLVDPANGTSRLLTVAGVLAQADWAGADHVFVSQTLTTSMFHTSAGNLLWVRTSPSTNNDVLAAVVNGLHVPNDSTAYSFNYLAEQQAGWEKTFLNLASWYVGFALIAAVAGLAAVMARSVEERRLDIGIIRSYGGRRPLIRRTFMIEAVAIAFAGAVTGCASGILLAWLLSSEGAFGIGVRLALPWRTLALVAGLLLVFSALATLPSVRRAGRTTPVQTLAFEA